MCRLKQLYILLGTDFSSFNNNLSIDDLIVRVYIVFVGVYVLTQYKF